MARFGRSGAARSPAALAPKVLSRERKNHEIEPEKLPDRRRGSGLCRPAAGRRVRQALRHRGLRHQGGRIAELKDGRDSTLECSPAELKAAKQLKYSTESQGSQACRVFIVTVPTPIDRYNRPDLTPLERSSETVGKVLKKGDVVVYESTVYPGCTEEICIPDPRAGFRPQVQQGFLRRVFSPSASIPATRNIACRASRR